MKIKISLFKGVYSASAILLGLAVLSFLLINRSEDLSEPENQTETTIETTKIQTIPDESHAILPKKKDEKENLQSADTRKGSENLEKENARPQSKSEVYVEAESIVEGVGLSEKELRALHAKQRQEIDQMHGNMDSNVIAPAEEGGKGYTLGELLALHEQQKQAIANSDDFNEIAVPALKEGSPGLTRTDLIELHKQQRHAIENAQNWDQIVIPDSEDGYPGLTWDEVATVQELQADEILERAADPYDLAAPYPEYGGTNMTVQELKNLHMRQSFN